MEPACEGGRGWGEARFCDRRMAKAGMSDT